MSVLRLEAGTYQQEAIGLYQRMGFRQRGSFGPYAAMPATSRRASFSRRRSRRPRESAMGWMRVREDRSTVEMSGHYDRREA